MCQHNGIITPIMLKTSVARLLRALGRAPTHWTALVAPCALVVVTLAFAIGYYTGALPGPDPSPAVGTLLVLLTLLAILMVRSLYRMSRANEALRKSVAEHETSLQETHHRIKNNLALISSLISLEQQGESNGSESDLLAVVRERVRAISELHDTLREAREYRNVAMEPYLRRVVDGLRSGVASSGLSLKVSGDIALPGSKAIPCGLIVTELVTNAVKHSGPDQTPEVSISLAEPEVGEFELAVCDSGGGFDEAGESETGSGFAGSDEPGDRPAKADAPGGVPQRRSGGTAIVDALVEQLGGTISRTNIGRGAAGARVTVRFPASGERERI